MVRSSWQYTWYDKSLVGMKQQNLFWQKSCSITLDPPKQWIYSTPCSILSNGSNLKSLASILVKIWLNHSNSTPLMTSLGCWWNSKTRFSRISLLPNLNNSINDYIQNDNKIYQMNVFWSLSVLWLWRYRLLLKVLFLTDDNWWQSYTIFSYSYSYSISHSLFQWRLYPNVIAVFSV